MGARFELQPTLADALVHARPLHADDFESLHAVAADPLVWEQHPNPLRWQREVFRTYFEGAMASGGALLVSDAATGTPIGSTRYYDFDIGASQVAIGYTFFARDCWGRGHNRALKTLMLDHALRIVQRVVFHVGASNRRSRIAMERLGGQLIGEVQMAYHGEATHTNVVYAIDRVQWQDRPGEP